MANGIQEILDDLKVKAMMFDMDVDIEALRVVEKRKDERPHWQLAWNEKRSQADFDEQFDIDRE